MSLRPILALSAQAGVVTLTGHVESLSEKLAAEQAAFRVRGVKAVAEEIEVRLPFERRRDDADIAAAAIDRLGWNDKIPADRVKVKVEKGWVTLTGTADWAFHKGSRPRWTCNAWSASWA